MVTRPNLDHFLAGWRGPLLAALLALVAGLPGLLLLPPLDRDESRYAQATAQMLESDDFVDIRFQQEPRWNKPVGAYWLQAAAVSLTSRVENRDIGPYRLPSLLGAMAAAAAAAWAGAALFGQRAGFLAGAMLGTGFLMSTLAGIATTDALLCGAVTVAMAALARIYMSARAGARPTRPHKFLFWLGLGLAILLRGPSGLLVIVPAIVTLSLWDRDIRWLRRLGWGWGVPIVALIVGPWAIAITISTDGAFWREAIDGGLFGRGGGQAGHGGFPGLYLALAPLLLFPATLMLPAALETAWRGRAEPAVRVLVCWLVPAWVIFELLPGKPWQAALPTFGALALLSAAALNRPISDLSRRLGSGLAIAAAVVICGVTVYGLTLYGSPPARTWATVTVVGAVVAGVGGAFLLMNQAAVSAVLASIIFGLISHAALAGVLWQLKPLTISPQLVRTLEAAGVNPRQGLAPGPVAITGFHEPSFVFLTGTDTQLTNAAGAATALSEGRPAIVEAADADAFRRALLATGAAGRAVGVVSGHNYSTGDDVSLTVYAPTGGAPGVRGDAGHAGALP